VTTSSRFAMSQNRTMSFPSFRLALFLPLVAVLVSASAARAEEKPEGPAATTEESAKPDSGASTDAAPEKTEPAEKAAPAAKRTKVEKEEAATVEPTTPAHSGYGNDLATGVPLGASGPRQIVHVESKPSSAMAGKFEVSVTMPVQVNPTFTEHVGNGLEVAYHFSEPFSLLLGGTYFWHSQPSEFTDTELLSKAVQAPTAAEDVSEQWEAHAGFEFMPIYAKTAVFGLGTLRFGVYGGGGGGVVSTKVELQPPSSSHQTFGDTGLRPSAYLNVGFRLFLGDHFSIKLEVRDTVFASYVDKIRGCVEADIAAAANNTGPCVKQFPNKLDATVADQVLTNDNPQSTKVIDTLAFAAVVSVLF
jgi:outer membrane beta-barrel protein